MKKTKYLALPLLCLQFYTTLALAASAPSTETGASPTATTNAPGTPAVNKSSYNPADDNPGLYGGLPSAVPEGLSAEAENIWKRDTLFGDWGGARRTLGDHGIVIAPVYTGEVMGNLRGGAGGYSTVNQNGGVGRGFIYEHSLNLPIDIDLSRIFTSWHGATFHTNALWIAGPGLSPSYTGDISNTSNIQGFNTFRLQELWLQQNFMDDKISIKAGQLAADAEFFTTSSGALFINGTFGAFTLVGSNLPDPQDPPVYPMAAPGVRIRLQPIAPFYFQAGVYDGNTESQVANNHGVDFHINSESGALVFSEVGYLLNQASGEDGLQGTYKLGSFVHTHNFSSWTSQANGTPDSSGSDFGLYGVIDQQLYSESGRAISIFARPGYAPSSVNAVEWYIDGGFNFTGVVPGRPNDVAGLAVARSSFSSSYSDAQMTLNGTSSRSAETVLEATYKVQMTPWWTLQPDFQYIFTPSGVDGAVDAVVLGLRTTVNF